MFGSFSEKRKKRFLIEQLNFFLFEVREFLFALFLLVQFFLQKTLSLTHRQGIEAVHTYVFRNVFNVEIKIAHNTKPRDTLKKEYEQKRYDQTTFQSVTKLRAKCIRNSKKEN